MACSSWGSPWGRYTTCQDSPDASWQVRIEQFFVAVHIEVEVVPVRVRSGQVPRGVGKAIDSMLASLSVRVALADLILAFL